MGSASIEFVCYGLAVALILHCSRSMLWRRSVLLLASLTFLGFFFHTWRDCLPLLGFLTFGFVGVRLLQARLLKSVAPLLIIGVLAFVWLKKYAFIPDALLIPHPYVTLGISYIFFRILHLMIDAAAEAFPEKVSLISYVNYTVNFTTLISGPIQRYQDFAKTQLADEPMPLTILDAGIALGRILIGFYKVNVLSLIFSMMQTSAMAALVAGSDNERIISGIIIVASYPLFLYCNFSGYIDIVIGLARLCGMELPENFDRPFSSGNFLVFWSRWHITLSNWLKTYVYNPLLMALMRRWRSPAWAPYFGVLAFFVTFFLIGVWHGQTSMFLIFGLLQGLGVSVTKLYQIRMGKLLGNRPYKKLTTEATYVTCARGLTYTWFAFTLLWFWATPSQLQQLTSALTWRGSAVVLGVTFIGASLILAAWESFREALLSFRVVNGQPILQSRYARTVGLTALTVVSAAVTLLLNAPAPGIVYKEF